MSKQTNVSVNGEDWFEVQPADLGNTTFGDDTLEMPDTYYKYITNLKRIEQFNNTAGIETKRRELDSVPVQAQLSIIREEMKELEEGFANNDLQEVLDACGDLIVVVGGMINRLGFDSDVVLDIINTSNESKFLDTEEDAVLSAALYRGGPRYDEIEYYEVGGRYAITGRVVETGKRKILKGIHYKEPDFTKLLEATE